MLNRILIACLATFSFSLQAQEAIEINYEYAGNADFSGIKPAIRIAAFTDSRGVDANLVIASGLGSDSGYSAEAPLADIIHDALVTAFSKSNVNLVDSGEDMVINGEVTQTEAVIVDRQGVESIQLTIRFNVQLSGGGRTIYETGMFGRGVVPSSDGLAAAVHSALDRMIRELSRDDYFLIELM